MPEWIHERAKRLQAKNPDMPEGEAFAIATQQSHALGKSPKGYGTVSGKIEAKKKYDTPKDDQKTASSAMLGAFYSVVDTDMFRQLMQKLADIPHSDAAYARGIDMAIHNLPEHDYQLLHHVSKQVGLNPNAAYQLLNNSSNDPVAYMRSTPFAKGFQPSATPMKRTAPDLNLMIHHQEQAELEAENARRAAAQSTPTVARTSHAAPSTPLRAPRPAPRPAAQPAVAPAAGPRPLPPAPASAPGFAPPPMFGGSAPQTPAAPPSGAAPAARPPVLQAPRPRTPAPAPAAAAAGAPAAVVAPKPGGVVGAFAKTQPAMPAINAPGYRTPSMGKSFSTMAAKAPTVAAPVMKPLGNLANKATGMLSHIPKLSSDMAASMRDELEEILKEAALGLPATKIVKGPMGPSIAQIAKPNGFGKPIAGATNTALRGI